MHTIYGRTFKKLKCLSFLSLIINPHIKTKIRKTQKCSFFLNVCCVMVLYVFFVSFFVLVCVRAILSWCPYIYIVYNILSLNISSVYISFIIYSQISYYKLTIVEVKVFIFVHNEVILYFVICSLYKGQHNNMWYLDSHTFCVQNTHFRLTKIIVHVCSSFDTQIVWNLSKLNRSTLIINYIIYIFILSSPTSFFN